MEFVARDMKSNGQYLARSISYDDVEVDELYEPLSKEQRLAYNRISDAWQVVLENFEDAIAATEMPRAKAESAFWGAQQRFFSQVLAAMQTPGVIRSMETDLEQNRSPIVQVVGTGGAALDRALQQAGDTQEGLDSINLSPLESLMAYVDSAFPVIKFVDEVMADGETIRKVAATYPAGHPKAGQAVENQEAVAIRDRLLEDLESLKSFIPNTPIEQIIDHFGSDAVAEVS